MGGFVNFPTFGQGGFLSGAPLSIGSGGASRADLLPAFQSTQSGSPWSELIKGGFGVLQTWLAGRNTPVSGAGTSAPIPIPGFAMPLSLGGISPAMGAGTLATIEEVGQIVRAGGGAIVGNTIRIARGAWMALVTKYPFLAKAAEQLGLAIVFTAASSAIGSMMGGGHTTDRKHYIGRDGKVHLRRRMNPLNPRAARKAITRIKSVRKTLQRIERQLPVRKTHHATHKAKRR